MPILWYASFRCSRKVNSHIRIQAIDLMEKCLAFSPKKRLDVSEALHHPYLEVNKSVNGCHPECTHDLCAALSRPRR